jgi:hypothetical protein
MIKQKSIQNDTNPFGVGGSSRGTSEGRESEFFSSSGVFVGTRIEEYSTETTIVLWRNTFLFYFSPLKKDNPNLVTTESSKT